MDLAAARSAIRSLPRRFRAKDERCLRLEVLDEALHEELARTYLKFQPRNVFQGLPPIRDEVCVKWVQQMTTTGINVVACSSEGRIVGHTALFPIDPQKCEMLVVVWPRFQNVGVGTELTRTCIRMGCELGFERIWLPVDSTNVRAKHIYRKCGFRFAARGQSRERDMVCDLSEARAAFGILHAGHVESRIPPVHFSATWSVDHPGGVGA